MNGRIKYNVMSPEELTLFTNRMERLLSERGIQMDHPRMKEELAQAGCLVNGDNIRFPKELIEKAISTVPREFTLYAPDEAYDLKFPHPEGKFYTRTCTGAPNYLPVEGSKHYITLNDTTEWFHLVNEMENAMWHSLPPVTKVFPEKQLMCSHWKKLCRFPKNISGSSLTKPKTQSI